MKLKLLLFFLLLYGASDAQNSRLSGVVIGKYLGTNYIKRLYTQNPKY